MLLEIWLDVSVKKPELSVTIGVSHETIAKDWPASVLTVKLLVVLTKLGLSASVKSKNKS